MPRFLIFALYNLSLPIFLCIGLPGYLIKGFKRGNLRRNFSQRFGSLPTEARHSGSGDKPIWLHAVSVGEVLVATKVIRAVREREPGRKMILSTTTTTGYRVAEKELSEDHLITVIHNPVDLPLVVRRVVRDINPEMLVLIESEIWPNLVHFLKKKGIPVLLANARLSPRSESRYRKVLPLVAPIFSLVDRAAVPFEPDIERWSALGIEKDRITETGSVKFDESSGSPTTEKEAELEHWLRENGPWKNGPIMLAGSTHAGEEAICGEAWQALKSRYPDLALVIVPRHAERAPDFKPELEALGLTPIFRGAVQLNPDVAPEDSPVVYVSDTTGELRAWFQIASVVFMGKSLTGKGGQNPVEPILAGKPVIVGPHMQNFREVVEDLLREQGLTRVDSAAELEHAIERFLENPDAGSAQANRGKLAMEKHHGAASRTADWILGA